MLKKFKNFADMVNSYRKVPYRFKEIVKKEANSSARILEVGCNIRPILSNSNTFILDGLDPDTDIDLNEAEKKFNQFYNLKIEDFNSQNRYNLIVLDMVYEHLEDNNLTMDVLKNSLSENGKILIHAPSNLHPFSLLNQLLPDNLKLKLLNILRPWSNPGTVTGWKSYYDKCNIISIKKLLHAKGLVIEQAGFRYNGSDYFAFFPPLFLLIVIYEELISMLGLSPLCSHFMLIIRKRKTDDNNGYNLLWF